MMFLTFPPIAESRKIDRLESHFSPQGCPYSEHDPPPKKNWESQNHATQIFFRHGPSSSIALLPRPPRLHARNTASSANAAPPLPPRRQTGSPPQPRHLSPPLFHSTWSSSRRAAAKQQPNNGRATAEQQPSSSRAATEQQPNSSRAPTEQQPSTNRAPTEQQSNLCALPTTPVVFLARPLRIYMCSLPVRVARARLSFSHPFLLAHAPVSTFGTYVLSASNVHNTLACSMSMEL